MTGCEHFYPDLESMALRLKGRIKEKRALQPLLALPQTSS